VQPSLWAPEVGGGACQCSKGPLLCLTAPWRAPSPRSDQRTWDNNRGADYHTAVAAPEDGESLVATVLEAMQRESAAADAAAEERAAARAGGWPRCQPRAQAHC
jgi:hypothetical protein